MSVVIVGLFLSVVAQEVAARTMAMDSHQIGFRFRAGVETLERGLRHLHFTPAPARISSH